MKNRTLFKYIWAFPNTLIGMPFVMLAVLTGGGWQIVDGVVEAYGGSVEWILKHCTFLRGGAAAITFGHVVLGCNLQLLQSTRKHERVHVRQYEQWGPLFIPAYLISSCWIYCRGGRPYTDNPFEYEARKKEDGDDGLNP